ncbi:MAG: rane-bound lytic murein transglycosylase, partial [Acidobacteriota bacterium]|nr:rane-bound lytic murein transglycosylase [Acidobacteriota bacterium]
LPSQSGDCGHRTPNRHGSRFVTSVVSGRVFTVLLLLLAACGKEQRTAPTPPRTPKRVESATPKPLDVPAPPAARTPPIVRDLPEVESQKTLRVLFTFNSTGYFIFRGETMGYEHELLARFAKEMKLKLVPVVVRDSNTLFEQLNRGDGDIVAAQLVAPANETEVLVTDGLYETSPVVVQRGAADATTGHSAATTTALEREERETGTSGVTVRARLVGRPSELGGRDVHLSRRSSYRRLLLELNDSLTDDVHVVEVDESADRLIQRLAEGEIGYTVAAENVAKLKTSEYANLVIQPALGPPQQVVWAVRRNAPRLHDALNVWIRAQRKSGLLNILYRKYFLDRRGFNQRASSRYLTGETGTLSPYDEWFREYAKIPGWDWRLIASQAYQESRFNNNAKSWAGAVGLMQIMPRTARELRVDPRNARQSVEGACRYLWKLDDRMKEEIPREEERVRFILAAYNVGQGHVDDARRLAEKYGDDPSSWDDVAYWLIRKSKRGVYNDPVVKYGFARGTEPVDYVERILDRFEHYKNFVPREREVEEISSTPPP